MRPVFQSTPPVKAATAHPRKGDALCAISIHAAREGGDGMWFGMGIKDKRFQSTPPVKAATNKSLTTTFRKSISIHAAREGGDPIWVPRPSICAISIHAAREGGDGGLTALAVLLRIFQSTPPVKAATIG